MFGNLGFGEILMILVVVLLLFGAKRLPEIGSSIGKGIREFKRSISDTQDAVMGNTQNENRLTPPSRQLDTPPSATPPAGGEPKRLSQ
ncbi:MAG: twin-arginine translocase TatA/TatE family subunit [Gemmatimonadales bacterium]